MLENTFWPLLVPLMVYWLALFLQPSSSSSPSNFTDQQSLLAFKSGVTGNNTLASNWTESANFCDWVGVECSKKHQRVTSLNLGGMGLTGTISPHIGNLSFLMVLYLGNNSFYGPIVEEISQLRRLRVLVLQKNNFGGPIPYGLHHCRHLQVIALSANKLVGPVPDELSTLPNLQIIYLLGNNLTGMIPSSLANISTLERLTLGQNRLHGNIPHQLAYLPKLEYIVLDSNYLSGSIPPLLFNHSSLKIILLSSNDLLTGDLPSNIGLRLPNLEVLGLAQNQITGKIPSYLSNSSMLTKLDLGNNRLTGIVPTSLGNLELLTGLNVGFNHLTLEANRHDLSFLTAFTRMRSLKRLGVSSNLFNGALPHSTGNLSDSLQWIDAYDCQIKGQIPESIGALKNLNTIDFSGNDLSGNIPSTMKGLKALQRLYLQINRLEGSIPTEIFLLSNLAEIDIGYNQLSGPIPAEIGNLSPLQILLLGSNALNATIPPNLWSLGNLQILDLSFNSLRGGISSNYVGSLRSMEMLDLSWNHLSGHIPGNLGSFESLSVLNLSHNSFEGPIPESLGKLITLNSMELSYNNLSGSIPKSLKSIRNLKLLNLSHNKLSGEVPTGGSFANLSAESFAENEELCGHIVAKPCKAHGARKSKSKHQLLVYVLIPILAVVMASGVSLYMLKLCKRTNEQSCTSGCIAHELESYKMFTYQELFRATNNFSEANLLGLGSFSSVYKGVLANGENIAVKLMNLQLEGAIKCFDAECKVIRTVRHRNLVKIISACTNAELRALVLEYMSNGSLHKWLYAHNYCLDLLQRVGILLDVALAVEYLHHGQTDPVVHCDLKPSNVLLDEDMVAHVGDFGIAKILAENNAMAQTNTLGTFGYIAPEYGVDGIVSTKGDIYSYGIMLLETFARKQPTDEMFGGELSLKQWVSASIPDQISEVIDPNLIAQVDGGSMEAVESILLKIIDLGLSCCRDIPEERLNMKDVVVKVNKIKLQILSITRD